MCVDNNHVDNIKRKVYTENEITFFHYTIKEYDFNKYRLYIRWQKIYKLRYSKN